MFEFAHCVQFSTEELVKEVKNSIAEFDKHKQEYDEERVKEQVIDDSLLVLDHYSWSFCFVLLIFIIEFVC